MTFNLPPGVTGTEAYLTGGPEPIECPHCEGFGGVDALCPGCNGDGCQTYGGSGDRKVECPMCEGSGSITPERPEPEWEPPEEMAG